MMIAIHRRPLWDGEGLPPVGCECERSLCGDSWLPCTILFVSNEMVVVKLATHESAYRHDDVKFRPIRSEADKKRDEIAKDINAAVDASGTLGHVLYDAIAAGKIPHIRIE